MELEKLKYPIGKFQKSIPNDEQKKESIQSVSSFPERMITAVSALSDEQLNTPYRPEGWTIRQVVHHCADSHMNAFIRFKLALTEDNPSIKPYFEDKWAEMPDYQMNINTSIGIIKNLHGRWVNVLKKMDDEDFNKTYYHAEYNSSWTLAEVLALYGWHCNHHLAHITNLIQRKGW